MSVNFLWIRSQMRLDRFPCAEIHLNLKSNGFMKSVRDWKRLLVSSGGIHEFVDESLVYDSICIGDPYGTLYETYRFDSESVVFPSASTLQQPKLESPQIDLEFSAVWDRFYLPIANVSAKSQFLLTRLRKNLRVEFMKSAGFDSQSENDCLLPDASKTQTFQIENNPELSLPVLGLNERFPFDSVSHFLSFKHPKQDDSIDQVVAAFHKMKNAKSYTTVYLFQAGVKLSRSEISNTSDGTSVILQEQSNPLNAEFSSVHDFESCYVSSVPHFKNRLMAWSEVGNFVGGLSSTAKAAVRMCCLRFNNLCTKPMGASLSRCRPDFIACTARNPTHRALSTFGNRNISTLKCILEKCVTENPKKERLDELRQFFTKQCFTSPLKLERTCVPSYDFPERTLDPFVTTPLRMIALPQEQVDSDAQEFFEKFIQSNLVGTPEQISDLSDGLGNNNNSGNPFDELHPMVHITANSSRRKQNLNQVNARKVHKHQGVVQLPNCEDYGDNTFIKPVFPKPVIPSRKLEIFNAMILREKRSVVIMPKHMNPISVMCTIFNSFLKSSSHWNWIWIGYLNAMYGQSVREAFKVVFPSETILCVDITKFAHEKQHNHALTFDGIMIDFTSDTLLQNSDQSGTGSIQDLSAFNNSISQLTNQIIQWNRFGTIFVSEAQQNLIASLSKSSPTFQMIHGNNVFPKPAKTTHLHNEFVDNLDPLFFDLESIAKPLLSGIALKLDKQSSTPLLHSCDPDKFRSALERMTELTKKLHTETNEVQKQQLESIENDIRALVALYTLRVCMDYVKTSGISIGVQFVKESANRYASVYDFTEVLKKLRKHQKNIKTVRLLSLESVIDTERKILMYVDDTEFLNDVQLHFGESCKVYDNRNLNENVRIVLMHYENELCAVDYYQFSMIIVIVSVQRQTRYNGNISPRMAAQIALLRNSDTINCIMVHIKPLYSINE
uniref:Uncharacterized protein n=1 Tax=Timspurckia oligopyrenoides TaxID=708627 RepID=A0A7S0ZBQ6_9RHOD|mmetsp:Transcript_11501/g.20785  ORF Transcript_11501/g.20785 Transcript_11501/m.20785 type:complete len:953 (+) Transcript_11501:376-3234(+)